MRKLILAVALLASTAAVADDYIGSLSRNQFAPDGVRNPWSKWNNCFYPDSPCNRFGPYGNRFSPYSGLNEFSVEAPRVYGGPFEQADPYVSEQLTDYDSELYGLDPY